MVTYTPVLCLSFLTRDTLSRAGVYPLLSTLDLECAALTFSPGARAPGCLGVPHAEKVCCQADLPTQLFIPQQEEGWEQAGKVSP